MCLATTAYVYTQLHVLLFLVLAVNLDQFQILQSYMLLLKLPILMCSCTVQQCIQVLYIQHGILNVMLLFSCR